MKIKFGKYNPEWELTFKEIKNELLNLINFVTPIIEHIGSTSVKGLSSKPIIDILVGLNNEGDLDKITDPLMSEGYIYYEKYNEIMPYRRFFVKHKVNSKDLAIPVIIRKEDQIPNESVEHDYRLAHIHVLPYGSEHWIRHIAFRDYLRAHPVVKEEYQGLKQTLSVREWCDGNEYNEWKDDFIKREEKNAIKWYINNK